MMLRMLAAACVTALASANLSYAAVSTATTHTESVTGADSLLSNSDLIQGLIATELAGDNGWHPATPAAQAERLGTFTDGLGILASGLNGLLNDFPAVGQPTKRVQYDLPVAWSVGSINILTGNAGGDGRIYNTVRVSSSTDGTNFTQLGYFESDPLGTVNNGSSSPQYRTTFLHVFDDASPVLLTDVKALQFEFFAVDNTQGRYSDPFNGVNSYTGLDDLFNPAVASPLVWEIDVIAIPEPTTLALVLAAGFGLCSTRRRA
ncbi:MAG: PEP-CTERM sorting domain-containing protein [Lacipirellulaceae bacterium]